MKERVEWEVCRLEPGGTLRSKKVVGSRQEASNLKYRVRNTPDVRVWIMREF